MLFDIFSGQLECEVWSVKCEVWSVKCEVWNHWKEQTEAILRGKIESFWKALLGTKSGHERASHVCLRNSVALKRGQILAL